MNQKKLLFICDYAASYTGNFIASLLLLTQKAQAEGRSVYFLFPEAAKAYSWKNCLTEGGGQICFCDFSIPTLADRLRQLARQLGSKDTLVHTHFVGDWRLLLVKLCFSNVICHYHMTVPPCRSLMKKIKRLVRLVIYRGTVLVGVSQAVTEDLKAYFRSPRCECIPNAVDFEMLEKCSQGTALPPEFQGLGEFRILMHGTDFYRKAVDLAVQAVNSLNEAQPGAFGLYVTTNDVQEAGRIVRALSPEAAAVRVVRPVENIKRVYDSMDLFISPSRQEAFGYAVVEAAVSSCQVAASDIPGQNTMRCIPGILWFEADREQALKDAIWQARENLRSGAAAAVKTSQRSRAMEIFSIEEWVQRNLEVYKKYFGG